MKGALTAATVLGAYRAAGLIGTPFIQRHLRSRCAQGKEDAERLGERLGQPGAARPEGLLIWLHAASVGESMSVLPLIERIRSDWPEFSFLITTGTVTSAQLLADRLPPGAVHQYVPVDLRRPVRRFLDYWRPDAALWVESEFWPNLLLETQRRRIPRALVNGRISPRSHAGWQRLPSVIGRLVGGFDICLAQSPEDADRLSEFGASGVSCPGNLKFAAPPLPADEDTLAELDHAWGGRPRWLAASTHEGEEGAAGDVHIDLMRALPDLLTVIVPRHPERGTEIARYLRERGFSVKLRSARGEVEADTQIYVADTLGELGLWYRLCKVVFVGGSLVPHGGQNPLEPARLGCAIIHGPHMTNFSRISSELAEAGAARTIAREEDLAAAVQELLENDESRTQLSAAAQTYGRSQDESLERIVEALRPMLSQVGNRRPARPR